jgi:hypothetical protein
MARVTADAAGDVLAARLAIPGSLVAFAAGSLALASSDDLRDVVLGASAEGRATHVAAVFFCGGGLCMVLAVIIFMDLEPNRIARRRERLAARDDGHRPGREPRRNA